MPIDKKTFFISLLAGVAIVSLILNIVFAVLMVQKEKVYRQQQVDAKVLAFRNLFTEKVLLANKEIDFNTRMALETSVRNLNDNEIFNMWEDFTKSETKEEATAKAKQLLQFLITKTSPQK